jgi:Protein of unknown function (DUF3551)
MSATIDRSGYWGFRPAGAVLALATCLGGTMVAQSAQAQAWDGRGPWCVDHRHYFDCAFYSYEQCMQTARGESWSCSRNPLYVPPRATGSRAQARPKRYR